jgi:SOS response regulatory protein OraA/RecX
MTERPDEHLAPVTYLFGGGPQHHDEKPSGRSALRDTDDETDERRATVDEVRAGIDEIMSRPPREQRSFAETAPSKAEKRAHNVGIAALARRGVSVAEMRDLLVRRELQPDVIEQEIERLVDQHLLDDETLAENIVRISTERKGMGVSAVRAELRRRKIDPEVVEIALESLDADDEYERALDVATSRARQLSSLDPVTAERRLAGYLQRRGYSGSTLTRATRIALANAAPRRGGPRFE